MDLVFLSSPYFVVLNKITLVAFRRTEFIDCIGHLPPGAQCCVRVGNVAIGDLGNDLLNDTFIEVEPPCVGAPDRVDHIP